MSAPISRDCKLEGLDLYAPRRARLQPAPTGQISPSQTPPQAPHNDQPYAPESDSWWTDETAADAEVRINDAIKGIKAPVGEEERSFSSPEIAPAAPPPQVARSISSPREILDWPPSSSDWYRPGRSGAPIAPLRARLDPEVVADPPIGVRRAVFPLLVRFVLAVGAAAIVAYGFTMISSIAPDGRAQKRTGETIAAITPTSHVPVSEPQPASEPRPAGEPQPASGPQLTSRLAVENQRVFVNEPASLGVSVDPPSDRGSILLAGLAVGTRLSAGIPVGEASWQLPARDLGSVSVQAPKDFVGAMNISIDLLSSEKKLMDRREVRFEWIAKKLDPSPLGNRTGSATSSARPIQPLDAAQATALMDRGRDSLKIGDVAAARLAFQRLADAGNAEAALALGTTFDPRYLAEQNVVGIFGDAAKARAWYQRAKELGSTEAVRILELSDTK